jgi:hypothetical protein
VATKRREKKPRSRKAETVASEDELREALRNFDLKKFDRALAKAINVRSGK